MKIAVIGTGRIGMMHARNLARTDQVDTVLLHDEAAGAAHAAAERLGDGYLACSSLEETFESSDGVVIATPTATHPQIVRAAVAAGVPALCEKPIASDLATMTELVEHVEAHAGTVLVGFQRRFDPELAELKRRIEGGEMGDILVVRTTGCDATPPDPSYVPTSGGIFRDLLIHDLDAVPWLVDQRVVEVSAQGSVLIDQMFADADDVDVATVTLTFDSGAIAQLSGTRLNPIGYDHRIEVLGSRDSLAVGLSDPRHTPLAFLGPEGRTVAPEPFSGFPTRFAAAYAAEMAAFCDVIAGRRANPSPVRDSLISLELAEACEQSRRSGAPIHIAEPSTTSR
ncbi:Gfo/Idh/MocA family protein [Aeromicrobium sp. CF3.5]|uniref:Gfo/Idh/MocA family protein n=1 Tax=Aeromicrobium sp. CF3.5 TaxID=3373078 RepID=UPI003EE6BE54